MKTVVMIFDKDENSFANDAKLPSQEQSEIAQECINNNVSVFQIDLMMDHLVDNYSSAKRIFGEKLIRIMTGYSYDYISQNKRIPEFQKELKKRLEENFEKLKENKFIDEKGIISQKAIQASAYIHIKESVDKVSDFTGKKVQKRIAQIGEPYDIRQFKNEDRYRDISIRHSLKKAIIRGHGSIEKQDLVINKRKKKGNIELIYALDTSASMKGEKIEHAKKAGIALAHNAIVKNKDKVGIVLFGSEIKDFSYPANDFKFIVEKIGSAAPFSQTDFRQALKKSKELFSKNPVTKHIILITDALPTVGDVPEEETLKAVAEIKHDNITVSVVGINLDEKGKELAEKIVEIGKGKFYFVTEKEELQSIVLEDYYALN